jgi:hypothetical protein
MKKFVYTWLTFLLFCIPEVDKKEKGATIAATP